MLNDFVGTVHLAIFLFLFASDLQQSVPYDDIFPPVGLQFSILRIAFIIRPVLFIESIPLKIIYEFQFIGFSRKRGNHLVA